MGELLLVGEGDVGVQLAAQFDKLAVLGNKTGQRLGLVDACVGDGVVVAKHHLAAAYHGVVDNAVFAVASHGKEVVIHKFV